jgi:hypothetical protein
MDVDTQCIALAGGPILAAILETSGRIVLARASLSRESTVMP